MIHHAQAEELTGLGQLLVCAQVGVARLGVAGGMIVGENHRSGPVGDDVGVDLARVDGAMVEQADGDDTFLDDLVRPVERDADKILLLLVGDVSQ